MLSVSLFIAQSGDLKDHYGGIPPNTKINHAEADTWLIEANMPNFATISPPSFNSLHKTLPNSNPSTLITSNTHHLHLQQSVHSQITTIQPPATTINKAMAAETAIKKFFSSPHFAVVGASSDPSKFGHKSSFNDFKPTYPTYQ